MGFCGAVLTIGIRGGSSGVEFDVGVVVAEEGLSGVFSIVRRCVPSFRFVVDGSVTKCSDLLLVLMLIMNRSRGKRMGC